MKHTTLPYNTSIQHSQYNTLNTTLSIQDSQYNTLILLLHLESLSQSGLHSSSILWAKRVAFLYLLLNNTSLMCCVADEKESESCINDTLRCDVDIMVHM